MLDNDHLDSNEQLLLESLSQQRLETLFQPIVNLNDGAIYGYEATLHGPAASCLFDSNSLRYHAEKRHVLSELEWIGAEQAIERFRQQKLNGKLFISLSPDALQSQPFLAKRLCRLIQDWPQPSASLVVVLSEWRPFNCWEELTPALAELRQAGMQLALQELGICQRPEGLMQQWQPDYIKLPHTTFSQLEWSAEQRDYLQRLLQQARAQSCTLILDDLQTREESEHCSRLGFTLAQGSLFAPPTPSPLAQTHIRRIAPTTTRILSNAIDSLLTPCIPLSPTTPAQEVVAWFQHNPEVSGLPIVEDDKPLGLVCQQQLLARFAERFSHEHYGDRPIVEFKSKSPPLMVERSLSLTEVGQRLLQQHDINLDQRFIIVEQGRYQGIGEIRDIMRWLTENRIREANGANPLTGLPGNHQLNAALQQALDGPAPFAVIYFDLNHFKPFNDQFGYALGDQMIGLVAQVLRRVLPAQAGMIGHIGGDDFVVLLQVPEQAEAVARQVLAEFEQARNDLFLPQQVQEGCFYGTDRQGRRCRIPLTDLAAGVLTVAPGSGLTLAQMAELASLTKHQAKADPHSKPVLLDWQQARALLNASSAPLPEAAGPQSGVTA